MNHELVGVRVVRSNEIDAAFHQAGDEMDISGKPIELGDDQRRLGLLGGGNGSRELRSIRALPALDLAEVRDQLAVVAGNMPHDRVALGVEAKAAPTLAIS